MLNSDRTLEDNAPTRKSYDDPRGHKGKPPDDPLGLLDDPTPVSGYTTRRLQRQRIREIAIRAAHKALTARRHRI